VSADFLPLQVSGATAALALDKLRLSFFSKLSVDMAIGKVMLSPLFKLSRVSPDYLPLLVSRATAALALDKLRLSFFSKLSVDMSIGKVILSPLLRLIEH
jgi:transcriptional antiterminator Rof (Rho-off)